MPQIIEPQLRAHVTTTSTYYTVDNKLILVDGAVPLKALGSYSRGAIIRGGASQWEAYAHPAAANRVLQTTITDVVWSANAVTFPTAGAVVVGTGVANRVAYWSGVNALTSDAGLVYNAVTNSLTAGDFFTPAGGQFGISGNELLTVNAVGNFTFSGVGSVVVPDGSWLGCDATVSWLYDTTNDDISTQASVGVKATAPVTAFQVQGVAQAASPIVLGAAGNNYAVAFSNSDPQYGLGVAISSTTGAAHLQAQRFAGAATAYDLVLNPAGGNVGFGTETPDRLTHAEVVDTNTASIVYANRLAHSLSSGTAQASFGVGLEFELENAGGSMNVAAEIAVLWATPANLAESPLLRFSTYSKGTIGPGYGIFWTYPTVTNFAIFAAPAGTVSSYLWVRYLVKESAGGFSTGTIEGTTPTPSSHNIYNDGVDILTLRCNADGSINVRRTAGAATFDVTLFMLHM